VAFSITTQPSYGQGGSYTAQSDRLLLDALTNSGGVRVMSSASGSTMTGDLAVTTTGAGNGSVNVAVGDIIIPSAAGYGSYFAYNDSSSVVGPFAACPTNTRIDLVVVEVNDTGATPTVGFVIVQGTAAVSPTVPATTVTATKTQIPIARINIPNGFTTTSTVAAGNIVDYRQKAFLPNHSAIGTSTTTVPDPKQSDLVHDTTLNQWKFYTGSAWQALPGVAYPCTAATRPTGSALFSGLVIYETDTKWELLYDGTAWVPLSVPLTTFTPTWTTLVAGTGGSAANTGSYSVSRGIMTMYASITFGTSGATLPSGAFTVTLPTAASGAWTCATPTSSVAGRVGMIGALGIQQMGACFRASATTLQVRYENSSSQAADPSATLPFTWAAGNAIQVAATFPVTWA